MLKKYLTKSRKQVKIINVRYLQRRYINEKRSEINNHEK